LYTYLLKCCLTVDRHCYKVIARDASMLGSEEEDRPVSLETLCRTSD
jgi:hypothetical protein